MSVISTPAGVGGSVAGDKVRKAIVGGRSDVRGTVFMLVMLLCLLMSVVILGVLVVDIVLLAEPVLTDRLGDFLGGTLARSRRPRASVQGLKGTFWIGVFTIVIAFPLGIAAAIYLEEYAHHQSRIARFIDINIRNLAGVPSIVYGILGLTIFVKALQDITGPDSNGNSIIAAGLTLAVLVLPIVIITSAEALRAVPTWPARGRVRCRCHPLGGDPPPCPALRGARDPDGYRPGTRPGARRGGAADPGRCHDRFPRQARPSSSTWRRCRTGSRPCRSSSRPGQAGRDRNGSRSPQLPSSCCWSS